MKLLRKSAAVLAVISLILSISAVFSACEYSEYNISDNFYAITITANGSGQTSRGISFFSSSDKYSGKCIVNLDPADMDEDTPGFGGLDDKNYEAECQPLTIGGVEVYRYMAVADRLKPGTKYFYRVGSEKLREWSNWGYFITDDGDDSFSFLFYADSQATEQEDFAAFGDALNTAVSTLSPEFIVTGGDNVNSGTDSVQWDYFFNSIQPILMNTTFLPVRGNHEGFASSLISRFNFPTDGDTAYYSFEYGNALFIVFDDSGYNMKELGWLEDTLSASDASWKIVFHHKSFYSSGEHAYDFDIHLIKPEMLSLFYQYGVNLVLSGHDHVYCRTYPLDRNGAKAVWASSETIQESGYTARVYHDPEGIIFAIPRSIGTKFYGKHYNLYDGIIEKGDQELVTKPVFVLVSISGGALTYTAYEYDREGDKSVSVLDSFQIV